uniref:Major facilitator superfamily domain-containing protein 1 n=1 Tax=Cacopsylla melanoneura TaxID=428564 RepID=A0A8D9DRM9_9HEMI
MDDQTLFNEGSRANVYPPRRSTSVRWTHPSHCFQRMVALLLMCLLGFGSYFCYDNPASLEDHFMEDMHLSTALYANLYTWYSWPNVICCFIGGFLIDSVFGIRLGTSLYSILVVIGQIVFALGAYMDSLYIAILGRFIFGGHHLSPFFTLRSPARVFGQESRANFESGRIDKYRSRPIE